MKRFALPVATVLLGLAAWMIVRSGSPPAGKTERRGSPSGAMEALDFWAAARAYPSPTIPDVGHALAYYETRAARTGSSLDDLVAPWTPLGPANIGGRTLTLALDPNDPDIIWAGSASGGLWKSTTAGMGASAWQWIDTGHPVLGVGAIAIDPSDANVMYIGTGEVYAYQNSIGGDVDRTTRGSYGIGILKTTDGGTTWTKSLDWTYAQSRGVWMIRLHPTTPGRVFAATTEGVYESTDAGASWSVSHPVIMATDLRIHPTSPDTMLAACGNFGSTSHGIYRTTDGGSAWTKITAGLPSSWTGKVQLALDPSNPDVAWASIADTFDGLGLWKSTDAGATWSQTTNLDYAQYQGWYSHWVLVSPFDSQTIFVGGIEIWRSTNGGTSFSERTEWQQAFFGTPPPEGPNGGPQYAHADHHFGIAHPTDPDRYFFASDGGVFRTTDGGNTFRGLVGGYMTTQFYNGFSSSTTNADLAIGGMQDNFTAIYEGTVAWRRVIGGDGSWTAINAADDQTIYGSWQSLNIRRSYDGGNNWTTITPPTSGGDETAFIAPYVLAPLASGPRGGGADQPVIYAARSRIYRSDDEGSNWTATNGSNELDGNPVLSLAVSASSPDTAFAGTAPIHSRARVFRTTNGGSDWIDVTGPLPDRYPSDLAVDPTDSRIVYSVFMGYGTSHVFRSSDAGSTWNDIGTGLPDVPTSAVTVDPDYPEIIYVGTDLGIWVSPDEGATWHEFVSGLPPAMVNDLTVFRVGRKLRAATHGNAVWERDLLEPGATGVARTVAAASPVALRVHPNPLRPGSRVSFELHERAHVRLEVFDVTGRRVTTLLDAPRGGGHHGVELDPSGLAAGVYFVRLDIGSGRANARVVWAR